MSNGLSPESAAVRITPEIQKALEQAASPEHIKSIMHDAEIAQGLCVRDALNPSILLPTDLASAAPKRFAHVVTDTSGKKVVFESEKSEVDALRQANEYLQQHQPAAAQKAEQGRDTNGRFTSGTADEEAELAAAKEAELHLKFMRAELSAADYLQQTGALSRALAQQQAQESSLQQGYQRATTSFLAKHPEWQGGEQNKNALATIIIENHWEDRDPLDALEAAYTLAQERGRLVDTPEAILHRAIEAATTKEELDNALRLPERQRALMEAQSSGIFGRR